MLRPSGKESLGKWVKSLCHSSRDQFQIKTNKGMAMQYQKEQSFPNQGKGISHKDIKQKRKISKS
jgi:hypothetical protein